MVAAVNQERATAIYYTLSFYSSTRLRNLGVQLMTEVNSNLNLTDLEAKVQDYLRVVETALGIISPTSKTTPTSQEMTAETQVSKVTKAELLAKQKKELASLRSEALYRQEEAKAIFVNNQAAFVASKARFIRAMSTQHK